MTAGVLARVPRRRNASARIRPVPSSEFNSIHENTMARKRSARNIAAGKSYKDILFEVKDQVAWITINRPRILNAFREQTLDEMIDAVKSTREDPSIACAVFTGAGDKSFSAGGDFYAMRRLTFQNAYMWN